MPRARHQISVVSSVDHFTELLQTAGGTKEKSVLQDPATGGVYIAKLGRRDNVVEVATEYLIYLAGLSMGADVAEARLGMYRGEMRFMSKSFIRNHEDEELVHGYQLLGEFYPKNELAALMGSAETEQRVFTVSNILGALETIYMDFGPSIIEGLRRRFVAMLAHDAIIGLVDRHPENWGVIAPRHRKGPPPRFAPLYDSAAGLFNEQSEVDFRKRMSGARFEPQLARYMARSRPLIGWAPEDGTLNHFGLVARCGKEMPGYRRTLTDVLSRFDGRDFQARARVLRGILSPFRLDVVRCCLVRRVSEIRRAIDNC